MPEIGLLAFARAALEVSRAVLPPYRSRFSKHQFTQPQRLAVLGLMRLEDWTFREPEGRLREDGELRQTLGLKRVPDFATLYRFLRRLKGQTIEKAVGETVRRMLGGQPPCRLRALIETVFPSVKRKHSARAPGRSLWMQTRQALLLGLSFNLYRLKHRQIFPRMSTEANSFLTVKPL